MACDHFSASMRLIALWCERVITEPDFALKVQLSDILTENNVIVVAKLDLLSEFDLDRQMELLRKTNWEADRGHEMIRQWLRPRLVADRVQ